MIDTIITFLAGAWFGALVSMFSLALFWRAHDVDGNCQPYAEEFARELNREEKE